MATIDVYSFPNLKKEKMIGSTIWVEDVNHMTRIQAGWVVKFASLSLSLSLPLSPSLSLSLSLCLCLCVCVCVSNKLANPSIFAG